MAYLHLRVRLSLRLALFWLFEQGRINLTVDGDALESQRQACLTVPGCFGLERQPDTVNRSEIQERFHDLAERAINPAPLIRETVNPPGDRINSQSQIGTVDFNHELLDIQVAGFGNAGSNGFELRTLPLAQNAEWSSLDYLFFQFPACPCRHGISIAIRTYECFSGRHDARYGSELSDNFPTNTV